ncbi:hypothetical protein [Cytobacillus sp. FSL H8-0458]|uniref:hypothetical protein n=1 Tax=Cytobacillus sp. FSL H8-0458 TaxID=2975346 RepID=UPI0030FAB1DB
MKTMMIGKVEMEVETLTGLKTSEFKNKFNEFNIVGAKLTVILSDGSESTLNVGELFSMNFQSFEPDTGIEIFNDDELAV